MVLSDSSRQSMIPSFLYSSSSTKSFSLQKWLRTNHDSNVEVPSPSASVMTTKSHFTIPAPCEPGKIEMYSPAFYAACTVGEILSCGLTHMAVTPLDLVKCNMQIEPAKYRSISSCFGVLLKEKGVRGSLGVGLLPSLATVLKEPASLGSMSFSRSTTLILLDLSTLPSSRP